MLRGILFGSLLFVAACGDDGPHSSICPPSMTSVCLAPACACPGAGCVDLNVDDNNCGACGVSCNPAQVCMGGACTCPSLTTECGAECADTATDANNCGACGNVCPSGCCMNGACSNLMDTQNCGECGKACPPSQLCVAGVCVCPAGLTDCGPCIDCGCVDLDIDPRNCGVCYTVCPAGQTCLNGQCA